MHRIARGFPRARAHHDGRRPSVRQYQRRARPHADHGDPVALRERRRLVAADQSAERGHLAEHLPTCLARRMMAPELDRDTVTGYAQQASLRVVIAGGGTGGHLYPGIAVARELRRREPEAHIVFVGTAPRPRGSRRATRGIRLRSVSQRRIDASGAPGVGTQPRVVAGERAGRMARHSETVAAPHHRRRWVQLGDRSC